MMDLWPLYLNNSWAQINCEGEVFASLISYLPTSCSRTETNMDSLVFHEIQSKQCLGLKNYVKSWQAINCISFDQDTVNHML